MDSGSIIGNFRKFSYPPGHERRKRDSERSVRKEKSHVWASLWQCFRWKPVEQSSGRRKRGYGIAGCPSGPAGAGKGPGTGSQRHPSGTGKRPDDDPLPGGRSAPAPLPGGTEPPGSAAFPVQDPVRAGHWRKTAAPGRTVPDPVAGPAGGRAGVLPAHPVRRKPGAPAAGPGGSAPGSVPAGVQ